MPTHKADTGSTDNSAPVQMPSLNEGNAIGVNNGNCLQVIGDNNKIIYQSPERKPRPKRTLSTHFALTAAKAVFLLMCTSGFLWMYTQWQPVFSYSMTYSVFVSHVRATLPFFWMILSMASGYYYCTRRVFV
jgi:hypothetical protein